MKTHIDLALKISVIIGIFMFIFIFWNKDRYEYHNDFIVLDKQEGSVYTLQEKTWIKVSPFSQVEKFENSPIKTEARPSAKKSIDEMTDDEFSAYLNSKRGLDKLSDDELIAIVNSKREAK
ncbi:MAG: hypothetical protein PHD46_06415 [Eubacteriales bacterium]|nr:hypothetical protein [Eubacteriales bacterium]